MMERKRYGIGEVALERALSKLGLASRSQAQNLIKEGRVRVHGKVILNPLHAVRPELIRIEIDQQAQKAESKIVYALHKPRGTVTTASDPEGRPTIFDLMKDVKEKLHTVGRLDIASSGLLLLTNETQLSSFLTDPASGIIRTYLVTVRGEVEPEALNGWTEGLQSNGERLIAETVRIQKASKRETHLVVELAEGKNREIRRLCKSIGHEVTRLRRVSFGDLSLGDLAPGMSRKISPAELARAFPSLPDKILQRIS